MRFNPKALIVSLALGTFAFYSAVQPNTPVVSAAGIVGGEKPAITIAAAGAAVHSRVNKPEKAAAPQEDPSDLWALKPLVRPAVPAAPAGSTT